MVLERAGGDEHTGIDTEVGRVRQYAVIHQDDAAILHREAMALLL
jgi:hypothetical protein